VKKHQAPNKNTGQSPENNEFENEIVPIKTAAVRETIVLQISILLFQKISCTENIFSAVSSKVFFAAILAALSVPALKLSS